MLSPAACTLWVCQLKTMKFKMFNAFQFCTVLKYFSEYYFSPCRLRDYTTHKYFVYNHPSLCEITVHSEITFYIDLSLLLFRYFVLF